MKIANIGMKTNIGGRKSAKTGSRRAARNDGAQRKRPATVVAVVHAIQILNTFSITEPILGVSEIARRIGIHKSSASRLLATLEEARLVERDAASGRFRIGVGILAVAAPLLSNLQVAEVARPYLEDLARRSGETISLSIWNGEEAVSVEQALGASAVKHYAPPGRRNPAHCTATGKAFLAHCTPEEITRILDRGLHDFTDRTITNRAALLRELEQIRQTGYAINEGEFVPDVSAVAAIVRNMRGEVVAAITATVPGYRFTESHRPELAGMVRKTAAEISSRLGYGGRN